MKRVYLVLCIVILSNNGFSQISFNKELDKNIQTTVTRLYENLRGHSTDTSLDFWSIKQNEYNNLTQTQQWKLYDTLLNRYFNIEAMNKSLKNQESVSSFSQYQALNGIDRIIDKVPKNSIFISAAKGLTGKYGDKSEIDLSEFKSRFFAGLVINKKYYPMLEMEFDEAGKFVYALPILYFDPAKSQPISDFLDQCRARN